MSDTAAPPADFGRDAGRDVRPVVPTGGSGNWGVWVFGGLLLVGGVILFSALSASREAAQAPSVVRPADAGAGRIASPEPLAIPARFAERRMVPASVSDRRIAPQPRIEPGAPAPPPPTTQPGFAPSPSPPEPTVPPAPVRALEPQVVFERRPDTAPATSPASRAEDRGRVTAGRFLNPGRTIPQGTVIPAVLETALDSTRAGGVRALVQRDIYGFDGTRILVPRGSRLYGEYETNLERGQNRALVQWTRLIRPDGVTIELDSPSSDPLGRAGIRGKVDTKFLQRFGGAILQSVLDIGVGIAVNRATDGVIVALPGSTQNVRVTEPENIVPTLKVKHGTSVSVFVARDLDFSTVDS